MGRSHGYRPTEANREQVEMLRAKLAGYKLHEWVKAHIVMQQITEILGHKAGPSGSSIEPRSCKYCGYFGHTRQHCQVRRDDVAREEAIEAKFDADWRANEHKVWRERNPEWAAWCDWLQWAREGYESAPVKSGEAWQQHLRARADTEPRRVWERAPGLAETGRTG